MESASCVSVQCEPKNFQVANCNSGNLQVMSHNSTSLWVARCELIIRLWVGCHTSLHYIKSTLSVYIISSLHVKQCKSNKMIWYILNLLWFTWKRIEKYASICANINQLQKQLFVGKGMTALQILENSQKIIVVESNFSIVTSLAILLKQNSTTGILVKTFQKDFFYVTPHRRLLLNL